MHKLSILFLIALTVVSGQEDYEKPGVRFDLLVRDDFFAGMFGDQARLDRGMQFCEKVLAKHPQHAQALLWHGGGLITRASLVYAKGDSAQGDKLWQQGLKEMNDAVALEPADMGLKIGRSATLIGISQSGFDSSDPQGRALLESAVHDYELVLAWQQPSFKKLSVHSRGELLFGLASGWSMLENEEKTRLYLERILKDCKGSGKTKELIACLEPNRRVETEAVGSITK